MNLPQFQAEIAHLHAQAIMGCGDSGCQILKPTGQCTNGGCRCNPRYFIDMLLRIAVEIEKEHPYKHSRWKESQP